MANVITKTILEDGPRNLVVLVNIVGDSSGEETDYVLIDRSAHEPAGTKLSVEKVDGLLGGFSAELRFDATVDLPIVQLPGDRAFCHDWRCVGGVSSSHAGDGANGDILMSTNGIADNAGTFTIHMRKS